MKNTRLNCRYSAEHKRKDNLMARIVFRMQSRASCLSLHTWARNVVEGVARNRILQHVVGRMRFGGTAAVLEKWRENTVVLRNLEAVSRKVLVRWAKQTLARSLHVWHVATMKKVAARRLMSKVWYAFLLETGHIPCSCTSRTRRYFVSCQRCDL